MPSRKSNSPGSKAIVVVAALALIGVAGFATYVQFTPGASRVAEDLRREDKKEQKGPKVDVQSRPSAQKPTEGRHRLMVPGIQGDDVKLATPAGTIPSGSDPQVFLVSETFKSMGVKDGRALKIEIKGGTAQVEVNQAVAEQGYSSMEEGNLIKALQLALGQFQDIERFTLLEGGNPLELGHIDLSEPIEVIRPDHPSDAQ